MQAKRVLTVGETMAMFMAESTGTLDTVEEYRCDNAGAEFNVSVGLTRLGHTVDYLTALGKDPFGRRIAAAMEREHIGTGLVRWSDERRTGFMLKALTDTGDPDIFYFRAGSAASTLSPADLDRVDVTRYDHLHVTGITLALSESCRALVFELVQRAKAAGLTVSFDPNLRVQLWPDRQTMTDSIHRMAALCDVFLPGIGEAEKLCGAASPEQAAAFYRALGVPCVIVKAGAAGSYWSSAEGRGLVPGFAVRKVVDTVGAGDGFAAGVISARLEGLDWAACARRGNAIGAIQVMDRSDNAGLPTREELEDYMNGRGKYHA